jgi:LysM repeat protein
MKHLLIIFIISTYSMSAQKTVTPEEYIAEHKDDAIKEMYIHKVPACITLAQGMLESGYGNSPLCRDAKNHFGIKCHKEWAGETYLMNDDEENECFRKYKEDLESYSDHSLFLLSRPWYSPLFELPITDYKAWCYGLKQAGYATDPKYPKRLIDLIEKYNLQELHSIELKPKQVLPHTPSIKSEMTIREVYRFNHVRFVIAKDNDSYDKIARDFNVKIDELITYNDILKTDKIQFGEKIYIQKKRRKALEPYHVVQRNETLKSISQLHGIRLNILCKKNKLKPDDKLKVGDILFLRQKKTG